jgi:hypothetical protein
VSRAVTAAALRRKIESWVADDEDTQTAIALRARPEWGDEPVLTIGATQVRVVGCPTTLAVRSALHERAEGERVALLTELTDTDLGDGLLAHLSRCTVRSVDAWDVVRQLFHVDGLDPTLAESRYGGGRWVADVLTEFAPLEGWPPTPGTVLTRDHALRCLTGVLLGLESDQVDIAGLLQWTTDARGLLAFTALRPELVNGVAGFVEEILGQAVVPLMAAVRAGHGADVIPLGLLAAAVWPDPPVTDPDRRAMVAGAQGRVENLFGGVQITSGQAAALRSAAEAWIDRALDSGEQELAQRLLTRAEQLALQVHAAALLDASDVLPGGFLLRLRAFAAAVRAAVPALSPGGGRAADGSASGGKTVAAPAAVSPAAVVRVQAALEAVERHRLADARTAGPAAARARVETARMALRLVRWLATPDSATANLLDAVHRQVREDGWVDRARLDIFAGDVDGEVGAAYQNLFRAVDARRATHDADFSRLLADATIAEAQPGALIRVEDVLDRIVAPIAAKRRVLLLVMDGMGMAAATELVDSLLHSGSWLELTPEGGDRTGILAALPTITDVSRCSLLSGRITVGQQAQERVAFAQRFPDSVLLHKADLRAGAGSALAPEVVAAVEDPFVPLVAAVINTIDDALDRSDPGTVVWSQDTIHAVRELLDKATERVVIMVSDHGHVVDRGPEAIARVQPAAGGNRWRPAPEAAVGSGGAAAAGDGEVLVHGSRVALGDGRVVLPWREELRYGPRKAGYHGGASPAEAVIPLIVLSAGREDAVPGWSGAPVASPSWWRETAPAPAVTPAAAPPARPRKTTQPSRKDESQGALFDVVAPAPSLQPHPDRRPSLVDALLASELYGQRRGARGGLDDDRVAALLTVLVAGGGRATYETLAAGAKIPAHRIVGVVTALRKLLQVEGYPVFELNPDGVTVLFNARLLAEQFQLDLP